jgi:hypothetical protein
MIILINTAIERFQVSVKAKSKISTYFVNYNSQVEEIADIFEKINPEIDVKIILITGPGYLTGIKIGCAFVSGLCVKFKNIYQIDSMTPLFKYHKSPIAIRLRAGLYALKTTENGFLQFTTDELIAMNIKEIIYTNCHELKNFLKSETTELVEKMVFDLFETNIELFEKSSTIKPIYPDVL